MKLTIKLCLATGLMCTIAIACRADKRNEKALTTLAIGSIAHVDDKSATMWGMSGLDMIKVNQSSRGQTPIMRTLALDARTVEILSRTQSPPLRSSDIRVVTENGRELIGVRGYLLMEVMPGDASAEHMSTNALARKWAEVIGQVLPQVAPMPSPFGT